MVVNYNTYEIIIRNDTNYVTYDRSKPINKIYLVDDSFNYVLKLLRFSKSFTSEEETLAWDGRYLAVRNYGISPFHKKSVKFRFADNPNVKLEITLQHAYSQEWVIVAGILSGSVEEAVECLVWTDMDELISALTN